MNELIQKGNGQDYSESGYSVYLKADKSKNHD
jgi:hypothetical protein